MVNVDMLFVVDTTLACLFVDVTHCSTCCHGLMATSPSFNVASPRPDNTTGSKK